MHLEQLLTAAARSEKRVRTFAIVVWLSAVLVPLGIVIIDRLQRGMSLLPPIRLGLPPEVHALQGPLGNAAGVFYMVTVSLAWLIALVYFIKSRPSLRRARDEYQSALIADLQRQIAELKRPPPVK